MKKLDLNILKGEIERKKNEIGAKNDILGFDAPAKPKNFLNGLVKAYNTMRETDETKIIKKIVDKSDGIAPIENIDRHISPPVRPTNSNKQNESNSYFDENDDRFDSYLSNNIERYKQKNHELPNIQTSSRQQNYDENIDELVYKSFTKMIGGDMNNDFNRVIATMLMTERIGEAIKDNKELIREIVIDVIRELKRKK